MDNVRIVEAIVENISKYAICGYSDIKNSGYEKKVEWIKKELKNGLKYKFLVNNEDKAVGGIEYTPGEFAYKPVNAKDFMFINCISIIKKDYKQKGYGNLLLKECIEDAKIKKMNGVAVIARKEGWMPGEKLFVKNGFKIVDKKKPDFMLLSIKFNDEIKNPSFKDNSKHLENYKEGIFIFKSDQCPYLDKSVSEMVKHLKKNYNIEPKLITINDSKAAQDLPAVFGTFCVIVNGKVVTENPISKTRLDNILKKEFI
jgi:N-acetylglutamate synthase-like GNAT family acetyltransferase